MCELDGESEIATDDTKTRIQIISTCHICMLNIMYLSFASRGQRQSIHKKQNKEAKHSR